MGSENSKLKKNSKSSNELKNSKKKNSRQRLSQGNLTQNSKILTQIKKDEENLEKMPKSKTDVKVSEEPNVTEEEIDKTFQKKRSRKVTMDGLRSLSSQNLVKINNDDIESKEFNNSLKENKLLNQELYEDMDDYNSIEDDDEGEDIHDTTNEETKAETEEEKKHNLMITNNIKIIFKDTRKGTTPTPENNSQGLIQINPSQRETVSSNTFDYELNFYRNGNDIRQSYLTKLVSKNIWTPSMKPKIHNCIIIFDWDDTLLPTSFLTPGGTFYEDIMLTESEAKKMSELEELVLNLLTETREKGTVYIITNAGKGWVEYSAGRFYPKILPILEKIKIVSARGEYEKAYPGNSRQWKIEAFLRLQNSVNLALVTNLICLGDSLFEMEAGRILASKFSEAFIKSIKFREAPKLEELIKQLKLVCNQFGSIYASVKNLTIRVERKKK